LYENLVDRRCSVSSARLLESFRPPKNKWSWAVLACNLFLRSFHDPTFCKKRKKWEPIYKHQHIITLYNIIHGNCIFDPYHSLLRLFPNYKIHVFIFLYVSCRIDYINVPAILVQYTNRMVVSFNRTETNK